MDDHRASLCEPTLYETSLDRGASSAAPELQHSFWGIPDFDQLIKTLLGLALAVSLGAVWLCGVVAVVSRTSFSNTLWMTWLPVAVTDLILIPFFIPTTFLVASVMMWYGPLSIRAGLACLMLGPGAFAFFVASFMIGGEAFDEETYLGAIATLSSLLVSVSAVAVLAQFFSHWTLLHTLNVKAKPPLSIGTMIELTVLSSIAIALILAIDERREYLPAITFAVIHGAMATVAVIALQIAFLSAHDVQHAAIRRWPLACAAGMVLLIAASMTWRTAYYVSIDFTQIGTWPGLLGISLIAACLIAGLCWMHIGWLRYCGWACVDRRGFQAPSRELIDSTNSPFEGT